MPALAECSRISRGKLITFLFIILLSLSSCQSLTPRNQISLPLQKPLVIAHRGDSGRRPEETLIAYEEAAQSADYLECDLQVTKDNVLICSHEPFFSEHSFNVTTQQFRDTFPESEKQANVVVDKNPDAETVVNGWPIVDYTYVQSLEAKSIQVFESRAPYYNNDYSVASLEQLLKLAKKEKKGVYLETKHSTWYKVAKNKDLPQLLLRFLCRHGYCIWDEASGTVKSPTGGLPTPIFLQSFEWNDIVYFHRVSAAAVLPVIALIWDAGHDNRYGDMHIRGKADALDLTSWGVKIEDLTKNLVAGVGVSKDMVLRDKSIVQDFHKAGLQVHVWILRNEAYYLTGPSRERHQNIADQFKSDPYLELGYFLDIAHVDGVFHDFPTSARNYIVLTTRMGPETSRGTALELSSSASLTLAVACLLASFGV